MNVVTDLAAMGFRRWHERRLIVAHGFLVACVIALVMVAVSVEGISLRSATKPLVTNVLLLFASGAIAIWTWLRYQHHMIAATTLASAATCPGCAHFGAITCATQGQMRFQIRCKKCDHAWTLETDAFEK